MTNYQLQRTGGAAVCFIGELRAEAHSAPEVSGKDGARKREHSIRVFQTRALLTWIVEIQYATTWKDEHEHVDVHVMRGADKQTCVRGIMDRLANHDATAHIVGFPPNPDWAGRQERLLAWHRAEWLATVSRAIAQIPGALEQLGTADDTDDTRRIALERCLERAEDHATVLGATDPHYSHVAALITGMCRACVTHRQDQEMGAHAPTTVEEREIGGEG